METYLNSFKILDTRDLRRDIAVDVKPQLLAIDSEIKPKLLEMDKKIQTNIYDIQKKQKLAESGKIF